MSQNLWHNAFVRTNNTSIMPKLQNSTHAVSTIPWNAHILQWVREQTFKHFLWMGSLIEIIWPIATRRTSWTHVSPTDSIIISICICPIPRIIWPARELFTDSSWQPRSRTIFQYCPSHFVHLHPYLPVLWRKTPTQRTNRTNTVPISVRGRQDQTTTWRHWNYTKKKSRTNADQGLQRLRSNI